MHLEPGPGLWDKLHPKSIFNMNQELINAFSLSNFPPLVLSTVSEV